MRNRGLLIFALVTLGVGLVGMAVLLVAQPFRTSVDGVFSSPGQRIYYLAPMRTGSPSQGRSRAPA